MRLYQRTGQVMGGEKRYTLVDSNNVNVSVEESIAEGDTANTTLIAKAE